MKWTDEDLMAYADDELEGDRRRALDAAMVKDASLRDRVATYRAQRRQLVSAYAEVLDDRVPDRLTALLGSQPLTVETPHAPAAVVDLASKRAQRAQRKAMPSWAQWGGMAASLLVGVLLGMKLVPGAGNGAWLAEQGGQVVVSGALANALDSRLASEAQAGGPITVQLTFVDKEGQYCRTFTAATIAGLACRDGARWAIQTVTGAEPVPGAAMKQATSSLPRAVLDAVDARMAGDALNATQEREARDRAWRR
jgi:hypothetical protein